MTDTQLHVVRYTRRTLAAVLTVPADNWEKHAARLILADFDDAVRRADADEFAHPQSIGRLCAEYERAVS
jgi:hypothetical protein